MREILEEFGGDIISAIAATGLLFLIFWLFHDPDGLPKLINYMISVSG